jgi:hypothetical protein
MIRGILLALGLKYVTEKFPPDEMNEMMAVVSRRLGTSALDRIDPDAWYPFDAIVEMADYYRVLLGKDSSDWSHVRKHTKMAIGEKEENRLWAQGAKTVEELLDAMSGAYGLIFNRGELSWERSKAGDGKPGWTEYVVKLNKFKGYHRLVCESMIGMLEAVLEILLKRPVNIVELKCVLKGDPCCEFTFSAPQTPPK